MKSRIILLLLSFVLTFPLMAQPWSHGKLEVSENQRYLQHEDGTPFFWLGETGWLLPERLNRDEAAFYLRQCAGAGYNVVQIQTINGVPAMNVYGQSSHPFGYDFSQIDRPGVYGYWDHMDYIIDTAASQGIYIGMVCIWGGLVKAGLMDVEEAKAYGTFLANRYKDRPNIIWLIGGDVQGYVETEVWETLAKTIKQIDSNHLMTYHPRGRTISTEWFAEAPWIDFHMFQSGHRRYGQDKGDKNYPIPVNTEEDSWRYVERALATTPLKPVLDGEPSYEAIPIGLHDPKEGFWQACDVRRYAYWSVFAGSCGHTYGHNSIMQFLKPGVNAAYAATTLWYDALKDEGFGQMKHLKRLMLDFPYFDRVPDQSILIGENGEKYNRRIATRGKDFLMVYTYRGQTIEVDLTRIEGKEKQAWWFSPRTGEYTYIGPADGKQFKATPEGGEKDGNDWVLVIGKRLDKSGKTITNDELKTKYQNE